MTREELIKKARQDVRNFIGLYPTHTRTEVFMVPIDWSQRLAADIGELMETKIRQAVDETIKQAEKAIHKGKSGENCMSIIFDNFEKFKKSLGIHIIMK